MNFDSPSSSSPSPSESTEPTWFRLENLRLILLALASLLVIYLCFRMTEPFLPPLTWAVALALVGRPIHRWIVRYVKNQHLAAGISASVVGVALLIPVFLVGQHLVSQTAEGIETAQEVSQSGSWREKLEQYPRLLPIIRWIDSNKDAQAEITKAVSGVISQFPMVVGGSIWAVAHFLLTIFMLFFFFRDQAHIIGTLRSLIPLSDTEATEVFSRISDTIHATIYGTILVAMIQGTLGGIMFWWLGLPAPVLWGAVMALLSIVPYLGSFVVWVPAAAYLALEGNWGNALILTGWGTIVVGLIDNLLYPVFVGKRLRMHPLLVFLAIFGGLIQFGAAGIVLGPVIVAITFALIDIWHLRTRPPTPADVVIQTE